MSQNICTTPAFRCVPSGNFPTFNSYEKASVQVLASRIYPKGSGYKATVEGRRRELFKYLEDILVEHDWEKTGPHRFSRGDGGEVR